MPYDLIYHRTLPGAVGEIFILSTTSGSTPVRLNAGNVSRSPSASPNGNRIAFYVAQFELNGDRTDDIFAVDRNGLNMRRLTSEPGYDGDPAWSPSGDRIAYRRIEPGTGRGDVWVMNADGSDKVKLTGDLPATESSGPPAWSPDASRIAFITTSYTAGGSASTLWIMNADGSGKHSLVVNATAGDRDPTWSPDGSRIAFVRSYRDDTDIMIVGVATGEVVRMALPGQQEAPAWSPDGRHIAYWRHVGTDASAAIYTVRANGTNVRLHTRLPAWGGAYDPSWIHRP
jgi:TolB protein